MAEVSGVHAANGAAGTRQSAGAMPFPQGRVAWPLQVAENGLRQKGEGDGGEGEVSDTQTNTDAERGEGHCCRLT